MDDQHHNLSLRLYEILDWIGASEEMRDKCREEAIAWEIIKTTATNLFQPDIRWNCYVFGSSCEGTTTQGLNSDRDILCHMNIPVVERFSDASQHGLSLLMVADETTKPGYFKLHCVFDKIPLYKGMTFMYERFETDTNDRICMRNVQVVIKSCESTNGPAMTHKGVHGRPDQDIVLAFQCQDIPTFAKCWLRRLIRCNRLNDTQLHMLKGFGCFFVGKNHPLSDNGPIEWRLSFSFQERELMASLNSTQHKCYVLLKIIKKDIILKRVPGSISSYHCKTCVLYAVENTPPVFWTRRNLLKCTYFCIKLLLQWVKGQCCPNYFMPNENMFDRLDSSTLRQVQIVLDDMVEHWCTFLWSLTCDDIGKVLQDVMFGCGPGVIKSKQRHVSEQGLLKYTTIYSNLSFLISYSLNKCTSISALSLLSELHSVQTYFLNTDCFEYHTEKETRQSINYFIPGLRLQIAQCVASIILTTSDAELLKILFATFKYYIEESKYCDVISAMLIVASYCLQSDRYDSCEGFLHVCETSLKSYVVSMCGCRQRKQKNRNEAYNELVRMMRSQDIPYREFARTCTAGCLTFHPHQANLVPLALRYEMYRSIHTPPGSMDKRRDFWFDWIVVDSRVYLYFLQYVLYSKTNKPLYTKYAINNLIYIINTDFYIGHRETAFNLLGWIFKQEHQNQRAMECFVNSWITRPNHNAAKWHALDVIRSINIETRI